MVLQPLRLKSIKQSILLVDRAVSARVVLTLLTPRLEADVNVFFQFNLFELSALVRPVFALLRDPAQRSPVFRLQEKVARLFGVAQERAWAIGAADFLDGW